MMMIQSQNNQSHFFNNNNTNDNIGANKIFLEPIYAQNNHRT
jgi:hypothetical protein